MDVLRLPLVFRSRVFSRDADGDDAERDDVFRDAEGGGDGSNALLGGVAGGPDGAEHNPPLLRLFLVIIGIVDALHKGFAVVDLVGESRLEKRFDGC